MSPLSSFNSVAIGWVRENPVRATIFALVGIAFFGAITASKPKTEDPAENYVVVNGKLSPQTDRHDDIVYADGTRYRWDGQSYASLSPQRVERSYKWATSPLGTQYRLYESCDFPHEVMPYVRVPMALQELQRFMECEGEVLTETSLGGIRQKVLLFRARDPNDSFIAVVQKLRVVHVQRRI